jgi:VanZ family protein
VTSRRLWGLWLPVVVYMAIIFTLSSQTDPPALGPDTLSDKSQHLLGYVGLAGLVCRALAGGFPRRVSRAVAAGTLLISIGYGITDELHQMFVPNRSPELADVYADAAGAVVGLIACWACGIIQTPSPKSQLPHPKR